MKIIREIVSWLFHLFSAVVITLIVTVFIIQPMHVEGSSMEPTLHDKEKLLINKTINVIKVEPDYGDIVIIDSRVGRTRTLLGGFCDALNNNLLTQLLVEQGGILLDKKGNRQIRG